MKVENKKLRFSNTLWVQHGGVKVKREGDAVVLEAVDEESYLKVFNHFGRVLKLYTYETDSNQWIDSATGAAPRQLDESLAGRVPPPIETAKKSPKETPGKSTARPKATAAKAKSAAVKKTAKGKSASAKKTAKAKPAGKKGKGG